MKKEMMGKSLTSGNVGAEMEEIKKIQEKVQSYWTMATNTCTGFYTIICC